MSAFRYWVLWLWLCSLLMSTIGISVVKIYCYCKGESAISLSIPWVPTGEEEERCADVVGAAAVCCAAPKPLALGDRPSACCEEVVDAPSCCSQPEGLHSPSHRCTDKTVKVVQLHLDLQLPLSWEQVPDLSLWAGEAPLLWECFNPIFDCWQVPLNKAPPRALLVPSGRDICIRHQLFRC